MASAEKTSETILLPSGNGIGGLWGDAAAEITVLRHAAAQLPIADALTGDS